YPDWQRSTPCTYRPICFGTCPTTIPWPHLQLNKRQWNRPMSRFPRRGHKFYFQSKKMRSLIISLLIPQNPNIIYGVNNPYMYSILPVINETKSQKNSQCPIYGALT